MGKPTANRRLPEKKRQSSTGRGKAPPSGLMGDISAVVLFALAVSVGLALATFSQYDSALIPRGFSPQNLCGPVGHKVASALYRAMGLSALVLPFGLGQVGRNLLRRSSRLTILAALAYAVLTASLAALAHLALVGRGVLPFAPGGVLGALLAEPGERLFSTLGTAVLLVGVSTIALILATDLDVRDVGAALATFARFLLRTLSSLAVFTKGRLAAVIDEHRAAVAELRKEEAERLEREAALKEAIADTAELEALGPEDMERAHEVADALAAEEARRIAFDDPAWANGAWATSDPNELTASNENGKKAKRARRAHDVEEGADEKGELDLSDPPEAELAMNPFPPTATRPEIVVSEAMLEARAAKKKQKKKETPEFAYEKAGEVFALPDTSLLDVHEEKAQALDEAGLTRTAEIIVATLKQHGIEGVIRHIRPGPVVTLYEFSPVAGVKLARIENLDKELTMALSAIRIRIIAPIPGKGVVGIEVPNKDRATVYLRDLLESEAFAHAGGILPLGLGKNIEGVPLSVDLQRMPHLLVAGTTGSGKSVGLNTMILSLLYRQTPAEVRMIMVDPKMTELSAYEDIPHLLLPVVTDPQKAARALQWAVDEMERRTQILADTGSKDLRSYNAKVDKLRAEGRTFESDSDLPQKKLLVVDVAKGETEEEAAQRAALPSPEFEDPTAPPPLDPLAEKDEKKLPSKLPFVVVVIDELADLMMVSSRDVEISLARLAQKARATGIHLIVATQRPSTDVITGMIKNNFPARISFRLASRHDSQTILNGPGAETLLGDGDMLVMTANQPVTRVQGAFVSEEELHRVVAFLKKQGKPVFDPTILKARDTERDGGFESELDDPAYDRAIELVAQMEEVSVSKLQREMRLGYNKAAKIIERMEREGIVGPANGVKPRQVLIRPVGEAGMNPNL